MKPFYFFISFIYVIVSMDALFVLDYKRVIFKTNQLFEVALKMNDCVVGDKVIANGLEHVIKKFVLENKHDLDTMSHILLTPDNPFSRQFKGILDEEQMKRHQALQTEIIKELEIAAPEVSNSDLEIITFKELGEARRSLTGIALSRIFEQIKDGHMPNVDLKKKCQFIALFVDIGNFSNYFTAEENEKQRTCTIQTTNPKYQKYVYKETEDGRWEKL